MIVDKEATENALIFKTLPLEQRISTIQVVLVDPTDGEAAFLVDIG